MSAFIQRSFNKSRDIFTTVVKVNYSTAPKFSTSKARSSSCVIASNGDLIGQPNPVSNLRPVVFHAPENETDLEREFRLERELVQRWNEEFWTIHNMKFIKEKKEFLSSIGSNSGSTGPVSADDMSLFYKAFLDKYWKVHLNYNFQWYLKNVQLVKLALKVNIDHVRRRIFS